MPGHAFCLSLLVLYQDTLVAPDSEAGKAVYRLPWVATGKQESGERDE